MTAQDWGTTLLHIIVLPKCCLKSQPNFVLQHFAVVNCNIPDSDCCKVIGTPT